MVDCHFTVSERAFSKLHDDDAALLIASRFHALRDEGCESDAALMVAVHLEVSVPRAAALIRRGCSARTAVSLLG